MFVLLNEAWIFCYAELCHITSIQMGNRWRVIGKKYLWEEVFISTVKLRCFELWMDQEILFKITRGFTITNLIKIRPKKANKFFFSLLNTFFENYMCFAPYSSTVIALGLSFYSYHTIVMPLFVIVALIFNTCPNF